MVMSYHILFDQYEEERLGGKAFGSTKSGIAPFYSDKYAKIGFQVSELFDEEALKEKVVRICETKNVTLEHLYHKPLLKPEDIMNELMEYKKMVEPYVCDVSLYLWNALKEGKQVLLEGQLGTLKDPDHGIYPMVTSSSTLAAYGAIGAGLKHIDNGCRKNCSKKIYNQPWNAAGKGFPYTGVHPFLLIDTTQMMNILGIFFLNNINDIVKLNDSLH